MAKLPISRLKSSRSDDRRVPIKVWALRWVLTLLVMVLLAGLSARSQDNVTIPKSRLEELERKERELERLKGDANKATNENAQLNSQPERAATNTVTAQPVPLRVSPPLTSLPPLKQDEVVDAMELANYYRADPAAADQRFRGHKFVLRGEIVGFEKPWLKRDYKVLLKTPDRDTRVICDFYPPETFNAVFAANHGSQLMGLMGETRVLLATVGEVVILRAECQGWRDSAVIISGGGLKPVR